MRARLGQCWWQSTTCTGPIRRHCVSCCTWQTAWPAFRWLARAVAILGDGAALRHAAALAGAGVFAPGTPLRFVHSIVRTAVHHDIPEAARGLRHAEAARLLAAEGADADAVCAHLLVCEPAGSIEVVAQLRAAAARAAGRGAPESAVAYLRRALAET